jgi:hypothetical protein
VVADSFSRIARVASLVICLIAVASFTAFAVEQSKGASAHQQAELDPSGTAAQAATSTGASTKPAEGGLHKAIDATFAKLSSPFSSLTKGIGSAWTLHIVNTLLVLLIYGFGLGLLARVVRFGD